jgi:hypothetical protein
MNQQTVRPDRRAGRLFLSPSFPRRRESRSITFGATRRHSLLVAFGWRKHTGFRLRGNDDEIVFI